jgi:hypothetical protein
VILAIRERERKEKWTELDLGHKRERERKEKWTELDPGHKREREKREVD